MPRPQCLLPDVQGSLKERFRFCIPALLIVESGQAMERGCHIGMLRTRHLLKDVQGSLKERFCFRVLALLFVKFGQAIERGGYIGMLRTRHLLKDVQGSLEKWGCLRILDSLIHIGCGFEQQGSQIQVALLPGDGVARTDECMGH